MTHRRDAAPMPAIAAGMAISSAFTIALALMLSVPPSALARGKAAPAQPAAAQESMSPEVTEQYCEEEKRRAHEWMTWAADKRSECKAVQGNPEARAACLKQSMTQLDAFEKEHAEIYLNQVRNLRGDHPVVVNILKRLKSHKDLAGNILEKEDVEPDMLGHQLKLSCISSVQQSAARSPKR